MLLTFVLLSLIQVHAQDYLGSIPGRGFSENNFYGSYMYQNKMYYMEFFIRNDTTTIGDVIDSVWVYGSDFSKRTLVLPETYRYYWRYTETTYAGSTSTRGSIPQNYYFGPVDISGMYLTQTLFNDDSKFEYVVPHFDEGYDMVYTSNVSGYGAEEAHLIRQSGYDVYNEDGDLVTTIRCADDETWYGGEPNIVVWDNTLMFYGRVYDKTDFNPYGLSTTLKCNFYRIDRQTQKVEKVASVPFSVRPTVMERGQEIVVELDEGSSAREIEVVNGMGQTVKRVPVAAGQREVRINSAEMGSGMNFISTRSAEGQGTVKIIVR